MDESAHLSVLVNHTKDLSVDLDNTSNRRGTMLSVSLIVVSRSDGKLTQSVLGRRVRNPNPDLGWPSRPRASDLC
jgi:hypothetical protein